MVIGLTDLEKKLSKIMINRRLQHLIFPICFCQRETIHKFDKLEIDF